MNREEKIEKILILISFVMVVCVLSLILFVALTYEPTIIEEEYSNINPEKCNAIQYSTKEKLIQESPGSYGCDTEKCCAFFTEGRNANCYLAKCYNR